MKTYDPAHPLATLCAAYRIYRYMRTSNFRHHWAEIRFREGLLTQMTTYAIIKRGLK